MSHKAHDADIGLQHLPGSAHDDMVANDTRHSTLEELASWTLRADQVRTF